MPTNKPFFPNLRPIKKVITPQGQILIRRGLAAKKYQAFALLGTKTLDVYLNDVAYWSNVPEKVWEYTIGGYQVIKKWLSYREEKLLGRPLP